jgi:predicted transcriptional regulator
MGVIRIEHPSYVGYRAQRSAGGKVRYKYFSLASGGEKVSSKVESKVRKAAEDFDRELEDWQRRTREEQLAKSVPIRPSNNTGVRGIIFRRKYKTEKRGRAYKYPIFEVSVLKPDGKSLMRRFRVWPGAERETWKTACDCLAEAKGVSARSLYRRFPESLFG